MLTSPRRRRRVVWLVVTAVAVGVVVAVALLLPNTGGKHHTRASHLGGQYGGTTFHLVLGIMFACFLLAIAYLLIRFVWRLMRGDVDERAGTEGGL
jgi:uncharacterized membrane protein